MMNDCNKLFSLDNLQVRCIREHLIRSIDKPILTIAITGSQALGLANSRSDVDVIVVIDDNYVSARYQSWLVAGKAVEALILSSQRARELCDAIDEPDYRNLTADTRDLILKLLYAIPIFQEHYLKVLLRGNSAEDTALKWLAIQRHYAGKNFNDIIIALRDGDHLLAVEAYRNLLRNEVDALLCLYGDVYSRSKRQAQRVKRIPELSGHFFDQYLSYSYHITLNDINCIDKWLIDALRFHKYLQYIIISKMFGIDILVADSLDGGGNRIGSCHSIFISPIEKNKWLVKSHDINCSVSYEAALVLLLTHSPVGYRSLQCALNDVFDDVESYQMTINNLIESKLLYVDP